MTLAKVYSRFSVAFFVFVSLPCVFRALTDSERPGLFLGKETANAFGLFRINWFHAVLHLALGIVGVASFGSTERSRWFGKLNFAVCAALVALGLITDKGTRHVPANTPDDLVNAAVGAAGFVVGFTRLAYWKLPKDL
jgi:hypothetical protein